jgi:hypothetical protein
VVDRGEDGAPVLDVRESEFEQVYNLQDAHSYWLFVALCREQGITLYKRPRQRATTVCAKTTLTKHDALWQRFVELSRRLHARLGEVTQQFVREHIEAGGR